MTDQLDTVPDEERMWRVAFTREEMRVIGFGMAYIVAHHAIGSPVSAARVEEILSGAVQKGLISAESIESATDKLKVFTDEDRIFLAIKNMADAPNEIPWRAI